MKTRTKIALGAVAAAALLTAALIVFYLNIGREQWAQEREAVKTAYAKTVLAKATKTVPFAGTLPYTIVFGQDKLGQDVIVWVSGPYVHTEYAVDGISKEQARAKLEARVPDARILRIIPGKLGEDYVWEVFYKQDVDGQTRYYYDFYRFKDGVHLDTYNLTLS